MKKIVLAAVLAAVSATPAFAANSDTKAGAAKAEVVAPIVLTHTANAVLNFGKFTAGNGSVIVDSAGTATASGAVVLMSNSVSSADAFTVTGDQNRGYDITTSNSSTATSLGTGLTFTTAASASSATLDNTGAGSFTVGGTLNVTTAAAAGVYNGTYNATVTYN